MKEKIKRVVLFTGYSCNNRCGFCISYDKRHIDGQSTRTLVQEMIRARAAGVEYLEMIGGEVTIRPDFLELVAAAKRLGFREIVIATNGRRFAYKDFVDAALRAGLTAIFFSIHGHDATVHDVLTGSPGSFRQLRQGVENLRSSGFARFSANTTVVRQNMRFLPDMGKLYLEMGFRGVELIFVDPTYGGAHRLGADCVPPISEAAPWMRECLDIGRAAGMRSWFVRYVPLCHFRGYERQVSEMIEREVFHTQHWAPDFKNEDVSASRAAIARAKPATCGGCALFAQCEGIWTEYLRIYGSEELRAA